MKNLSFLFLVTALTLGVVSCGNKDGGGSTTHGFRNGLSSTSEAYLDTQQPIAQVGNVTYQISQQSFQTMAQAFQIAQQQGIQPIMINGTQKFKARITGTLQQTGYQVQGGQQGGYPGAGTLYVTQAIIHR